MAWNPGYYPGYAPQQSYMTQAPAQAPQSAPMSQGGAGMQGGFRCLPVTSYAQVEAFQIPFDGSTTYFVDTSNGKIYAKTFDFNTGTAVPVTYTREQAVPAVQYATIDDLKALREELLARPRKAVKKTDVDDE